MKYIVSACLAGINCKYDGSSCADKRVLALAEKGEAIIVCPEQLGGLQTPRKPAERVKNRVMAKDGTDLTEQFSRGVDECSKIVKLYGCTHAILKHRSPSCGFGIIYDGTFSGKLVSGNGLLGERLNEMGLVVYTEETLPDDIL